MGIYCFICTLNNIPRCFFIYLLRYILIIELYKCCQMSASEKKENVNTNIYIYFFLITAFFRYYFNTKNERFKFMSHKIK